jgi:hypothetical protein
LSLGLGSRWRRINITQAPHKYRYLKWWLEKVLFIEPDLNTSPRRKTVCTWGEERLTQAPVLLQLAYHAPEHHAH